MAAILGSSSRPPLPRPASLNSAGMAADLGGARCCQPHGGGGSACPVLDVADNQPQVVQWITVAVAFGVRGNLFGQPLPQFEQRYSGMGCRLKYMGSPFLVVLPGAGASRCRP